jgi:hypothetical protein
MYPGGNGDVVLTISNPNSFPVTVAASGQPGHRQLDELIAQETAARARTTNVGPDATRAAVCGVTAYRETGVALTTAGAKYTYASRWTRGEE